MNLFNLFLLLNSVIVLILGGAVYFSGKRHLLNKIWGMLSLALFFWSFGHYKAMASLFEFDSLIWFRIANLALVFLPMLFLHLILIFLEDTHSLKRILPVSYASGLVIFITALLAPASFVKEVTPALSFHYYPVGGWLYKVFILGFSLIAGYGFCKLFKRFWGAVEFRRNQARYLFIGWLFGIAGVASFFPLSLGVPVYPLGNYFIIVFALITSYAIVKYHLMDIDVVINKAVLFAYFVGLTLLVHTGLVYFLYKKMGMDYAVSSTFSGGVIMLFMLFLVHYQDRLKLEKRLVNVIYENRYNYRDVIEQLNKAATSALDFDGLIDSVVMILVDNLGIEKVSLLLVDRYKASYSVKAAFGLPKEIADNFSLPLNSEFISWLKEKRGIFSRNKLEEALPKERFRIIAKDLKPLQAKFSMPLFYKNELVGILSIGDKKSGRPISQEEIDIINSLTQQIVIHIKNVLLYEESITDSLTKLYHHEYFYHRLKEELDRAKRYLRPLSLLMIDLDGFKSYNDRYGHQAGDRLLKEVAYLLRSSVRRADIVARYGGEEFCVITPETNKRGAERLGERLRKLVLDRTETIEHDEELLRGAVPVRVEDLKGVSISVGITSFERVDQDLDRHRFIKQADKALYKAKDQGGNKVVPL